MGKYIWVLIILIICMAAFGDDLKDKYLLEDPLKGAVYFTEKGCDKCHAIEGRGGSFGPDLARSDLNGSLLDIVSLMWNHSPQMRSMMNDLKVVYPKFSGDELAELASYIFFIAYFDAPGDIAKGRTVFSKKSCSTCHSVGGIGTSIGPDLSALKKYVSPIFLAQEMWNHGPSIKERMDKLNISWPEFEGHEISNLMAFLRDASNDKTSERIFMRPGNPKLGEQLFQQKKCITCHKVFGKGNDIGPDLTQSTFHKSVTADAAVMWNHGPAIWGRMDEIGLEKPTFKDNEMADLIAFLYFLRFFEKKADIARGEMLFNQKSCQNCHHFGETAVEGSLSLSDLDASLSKLDVAALMWNHTEEMSKRMTRKKIEWPRFMQGELNDLVEYILAHE